MPYRRARREGGRWCLLALLMCRLLLSSLLLSCASAGPATVKDPPVAEGSPPAGGPSTGAGGGDDLSQAFEPEKEAAKPRVLRPVEPAPVDLAAPYKAALAEGQTALKAKQLDAARAAAATAMKEALDGEARHQAGQLAF